jgi:hypothetical protein
MGKGWEVNNTQIYIIIYTVRSLPADVTIGSYVCRILMILVSANTSECLYLVTHFAPDLIIMKGIRKKGLALASYIRFEAFTANKCTKIFSGNLNLDDGGGRDL